MNVGLCGVYDVEGKVTGGQLEKTKIIFEEVGQFKPEWHFNTMNFFSYRKNVLKIIKNSYRLLKQNDCVVYIAAARGRAFFTFLFKLFNLFKKKKLYCIVIGSPDIEKRFLKHPVFMNLFKSLDGSFYEIEAVAQKMKKYGCKNTYCLPNFKYISRTSSVSDYIHQMPIPVCTFSRIVKEKGVLDAIYAVDSINKKYGKKIYSLDIYGSKSGEFKEFDEAVMQSTSVTVKGKIKREDAQKVLSTYYLLLFPSHHKNEGVPGSLIDALEAGLPIITTDVSYNETLINSTKTGIVYHEEDKEALTRILDDAYKNPEKYIGMRENCYENAMKYDLEYNMRSFLDVLEKDKQNERY